MFLNFYSNRYNYSPILCFSGNIHSSAILFASDPNNGNNKSSSDSNPNIEPVDSSKLLEGLDELTEDSDEMSPSEYISESFSTFEEAFPNIKADPKIREYYEDKKIHESLAKVLYKSEASPEDISEFETALETLPGDTKLDKLIKAALTRKYLENGSFKNVVEGFYKDIENKSLNNLDNQDSKINSDKLVEYVGDGKIIINTSKILTKISLNSDDIYEALKNTSVSATFSVSFMAATSVFAYRSIVKAYDKKDWTPEIRHLKSDILKYKAITRAQNHRLIVSGGLACVVMAGILYTGVIQKGRFSSEVNVSVNPTDSPDTSNFIKKNSFFLFTLFNNKYIKYFSMFLAFSLSIIFLDYVILVYNFLYSMLPYIKLIAMLILALYSCYLSVSVYLTNKYFYSKEEPVLSKYTPSLIKDEIKFLYEVSQDEEAMKIINQNNLKHIFLINILLILYILLSLFTISH